MIANCLSKSVGLALVLLCCSGTISARALSADTAEQERRIAHCIRSSVGGRAWLEKTLWGLRDQEAGWIGAQVRNRNGTHDLGPLQVNSWWVPKLANITGHPRSHIRWWLTHDACFNVRVAQWIFLSALVESGDYWEAIGIYHSPKRARQSAYAAKVARHLTVRFGPRLFDQRGGVNSASPQRPPT